MLEKKIKYTDYRGNEREEEYFFNLTKAECLKLETSIDGGLSTLLTRLSTEQNVPKIIEIFDDIICKSYGEISNDGKRFIKETDAGVPLYKAFKETEAYSQLFVELLADPEKQIAFINGIIPNKEEANK